MVQAAIQCKKKIVVSVHRPKFSTTKEMNALDTSNENTVIIYFASQLFIPVAKEVLIKT